MSLAGGTTDSSLLTPTMRWLQNAPATSGAFLTFPFSFEGSERCDAAEGALTQMAAAGSDPWVARLDNTLVAGRTIRRGLQVADERLARRISRFLTPRHLIS